MEVRYWVCVPPCRGDNALTLFVDLNVRISLASSPIISLSAWLLVSAASKHRYKHPQRAQACRTSAAQT